MKIFLFALVLTSCTSLKPVTAVSDKSLKSLALFEEIPTTYNAFCEERCQFNLIRKNQVVRDTAINCDCHLFTDADKATTKVYKAISAYFNSLGEISKGDLTTYDTKALNEALVEGKFASLTIDKNTVTAYSTLGRVILQAFTDGYRKRKLKAVIESANPSVQTLLTVFETSMTNLIAELEFQKERNYTLYNELLMERQTGYDKVKLTTDYYNQINSIRLKQSQLRTFSKSLNTIGKGHQKLFENRNKITAKEIRQLLGDYSAMLQDLIVDFKKL